MTQYATDITKSPPLVSMVEAPPPPRMAHSCAADCDCRAGDGSGSTLPGDKGPTGDKGPPGDPGTDGLNGTNGTNGIDGIDGTDGLPGADGNPGADGDKGPTGDAGPMQYAVGDLYITTRSGNPSTLLGYGTWAVFGAGRLLLASGGGYANGDTPGSATHGHGFTHPSAHTDHPALAHSGITVADHAAHTHTFTGSSNAATPDLLTLNTASTGVSASGTTGNPNAVLTHTIGQGNNHAAQAHSAHAGGAVLDGSALPPSVVFNAWVRTA